MDTVNMDPPLNKCPEPIAIVGIGCRWPGGVRNPSQLWDLLRDERDGFSEFKEDRINVDGFYHPDGQRPGSMYTRGGFLLAENTRNFDHTFFGMTAIEAMALDPSQRKLLEVTYEAIESAGISLDQFSGTKTGVFVGNFNNEHQIMQYRDPDHTLPYVVTGGGPTILSNRINYVFNLKGPSLMVDTACSASMYALHLAVIAIRNGDCTGAIVAGANVILGPDNQIFTTKLGAVSPTSRCHTFDASADGYARAEGFGAFYLKRFSDAVRDGDPIRAVIRGTAFNANGRTGGISHPSPDGQEAVMKQAYKNAGGLDPALTGYTECHGTGTPVGDPIEVSAVGRVFAAGRTREPLLIGSIKPNLGHSEAASAMSQMMKAILAMEHGQIPATIGISKFNPSIDFETARCKVVTEMTPWPAHLLRRVSINSFGYGGANAHCVLDHPSVLIPGYQLRGFPASYEPASARALTDGHGNGYTNGNVNGHTNGRANGHTVGRSNGHSNGHSSGDSNGTHKEPTNGNAKPPSFTWCVPEAAAASERAGTRQRVLVPVSGHDEKALKMIINGISAAASGFESADLLYTLASRRSKLARRAFAIVESQHLKDGIEEGLFFSEKSPSSISARIGFVFTGQGAQWPQMGHELLHEYAVFRQTIQYLDNVLSQLNLKPSWSIESILSEPAATSQIHDPAFSQTVCTALQIALVALLRQWGITPVATVGHSSGEIAAAYSAGRLKASEAIVLAYFRGRVVKTNNKNGLMMAVGLGVEDAEPYLRSLETKVKIAAVNSPASVTLSGETAVIESLNSKFTEKGVFARLLKTGGNAYHSHHMRALGQSYEQEAVEGLTQVQSITDQEPLLPSLHWVSSVSVQEEWQKPRPKYWRRNLESAVLFSPAVERLARDIPLDLLVEVGPHPALGGPIKQIRTLLEKSGVSLPPCLASLRRGEHDVATMLSLAGNLFINNAPIDLAAVNSTEIEASDGVISLSHGSLCMDLFQYPYSYPEQPIYYENRFNKEYRTRKHPRHDLLGVRTPAGSWNHPQWRNVLRLKDLPWLDDHKLLPHPVLPGAAYIAMAIEAVIQLYGDGAAVEGQLPQIESFQLRQVAINSALRVEDDELGVETVLNMEKIALTNASLRSRWYRFSIGSMVPNSEQWTEHCTGTICAITEESDIDSERRLQLDRYARSLDMARWHETFHAAGLGYGPAFQGLSKLRAHWASNTAAADVALQPTEHESPYVIHPATLDTLIQLALISCHAGQVENLEKAFVPVFADNVTIWNAQHGTKRSVGKGIASGDRVGLRSMYARVQLFAPDTDSTETSSGRPLVDIGQLKCVTYEASQSNTASSQSLSRREPYWAPTEKVDVDTLTQGNFHLLSSFGPSQVSPATFASLDTLAALVIASINERLNERDVGHSSQANHDAFVAWVKAWSSRRSSTVAVGRKKKAVIIDSMALMLHDIPEARCLKELHDNIGRVLSGETSSLKVLMESDLLSELSTSGLTVRGAHAQLQSLVDLLAHKNPRMRILEVGTGSAGTTAAVLKTLSAASAMRRFDEYVVTDSAAWSLADAKTRFAQCNGLTFQQLDIMSDPIAQDFNEYSFDLIIAASVLVEVEDPGQALGHLHSLLKPSGSLALIENTEPSLAGEILSRTFAGKWDATNVLRDIAAWNQILKQAKFSVGLSLSDYAGRQATSTVILSKPEAVASRSQSSDVCIVSRDGHVPLLGERIAAYLAKKGRKALLVDLFAVEKISSNIPVISLVDLAGSTIASRDATYFEALKAVFAKVSHMVWVAADIHTPAESSVMKGLLRSIAAENLASKFTFVEVDHSEYTSQSRATQLVISKLEELQLGASYEPESVLRGGFFWVERMLPEENLNQEYRFRHGLETEFHDGVVGNSEPFMARYGQPGLLSSLYFCQDPEFRKPLEDDWVEIKTEAIGLNMKDLAVATARFDLNKLSTEASGIITRLGSSISSLQIGDRVFGMIPGNMGNYLRSPGSLVAKVPAGVSAEEAASMPVVYLTSIYALRELARLSKGESVLIQSATGGLGLSTIRIARYLGAEVFATVGNQEKRKLLIEEFGIPDDHIFDSRSINTVDKILDATNGRGVDVIISSAGGDIMHEMWRCIAPLGRFIDVSRTDVLGHGRLGLEVFKKNATFSSFDMGLIYRQKPALIAELTTQMSKLIDEGVIGPISKLTTFDISRLEAALSYFSKGQHVGKLVITFNPKSTLKTIKSAPRAQFDGNAAYLLVGCLGGLGRSLATWMIKQGARYLIFLSRSGADKPEAEAAVKELTKAGALPRVVRCDITNSQSLKQIVEDVLLPIRGVVHAAMVEGDSLFSNASLPQIQKVLAPKVAGTLNLHDATRNCPLDFFLMTSSIVGSVGTPSQGAYVAANAFQDAFAEFRASRFLPATALALGLVLEVGSVSDSVSFQQMLQRNATYGVSETEFLRLFEGAIAKPSPRIVTGLEAAKFVPNLENGRAEELVWFNNARFQAVTQAVHECARTRNISAEGGSSISAQLAEASTPEEKAAIVSSAICEKLGELLSIAADDIAVDKSIAHYGVDSLIAGELRNWLYRTFGSEFSLLTLLNAGTKISELVTKAARSISG